MDDNMQNNFNRKLINLLKTDPCFDDEAGELVRAAVIDRRRKTKLWTFDLFFYFFLLNNFSCLKFYKKLITGY